MDRPGAKLAPTTNHKLKSSQDGFTKTIAAVLQYTPHKSTMVGGFGDEKDVDQEVLDMANALQADIMALMPGKQFDMFTPEKYTSQVVAGTNFLVKIKVGEGRYVNAKIFRPLPHTGEPPRVTEAAE